MDSNEYRDVVTYVDIPDHVRYEQILGNDGVLRVIKMETSGWRCRIVVPDTLLYVEDIKNMILEHRARIPEGYDVHIMGNERAYSRHSVNTHNVSVMAVNYGRRLIRPVLLTLPIEFSDKPFPEFAGFKESNS